MDLRIVERREEGRVNRKSEWKEDEEKEKKEDYIEFELSMEGKEKMKEVVDEERIKHVCAYRHSNRRDSICVPPSSLMLPPSSSPSSCSSPSYHSSSSIPSPSLTSSPSSPLSPFGVQQVGMGEPIGNKLPNNKLIDNKLMSSKLQGNELLKNELLKNELLKNELLRNELLRNELLPRLPKELVENYSILIELLGKKGGKGMLYEVPTIPADYQSVHAEE